MKLIKLNNTGLYIIVDDYNTKEAYDGRITKGTIFYKDDIKDIYVAEYSPASKVSRPVIACNNPYSDSGVKNGNKLLEINNEELKYHLKNYKGIDKEILSGLCCYDERNPDRVIDDEAIKDYKESISKGKCYCDNCFYGRTKLAEQIIKNYDKKFTLEDMEKCFYDAKVSLKFGSFEEYKKYISWDEDRRTEWDIEIEMEYQKTESGLRKTDLPMIPKKDEQGYIKIIKIK